MRAFFTLFALVISATVLSNSSIKYIINYDNDTHRICKEAIEQLVNDALKVEINSKAYFQAVVDVHSNSSGSTDYFVVNLYRSDCYQVRVYRIDIDDLKTIAITPDYVEESRGETVCGSCPDPDVEIVISYIEDALFPGAIQHGWGTWSMAQAAGLKAALVIGYNESKQTMLNYLSCPKLRVWGRIGHGSKDAITMNDYKGKITASELAGLSNNIKGKTFIFNSCLCHNDPFEPAMRNAGAYFFAAGDISLSGGKEGVFSSFFNRAIKNKMELSKAMDEAIKENNYPNAWGYSGAASGPYYLQFGVTGITDNNVHNSNDFSVYLNGTYATFTTNTKSAGLLFYIFNPMGALIYNSTLSNAQRSWDLTSVHGQKVTSGTYLAVLKNHSGENISNTVFTIAK